MFNISPVKSLSFLCHLMHGNGDGKQYVGVRVVVEGSVEVESGFLKHIFCDGNSKFKKF
jgi:hypothetical protein